MSKFVKIMVISMAALGLSACATHQSSNGLENYKETSFVTYQCGSDKVTAKFLNDEFNSIALVSLNNEPAALLSNSIAASGAKYQGGIYELWTKGNDAIFTNFLKAPNKPISCKTIN